MEAGELCCFGVLCRDRDDAAHAKKLDHCVLPCRYGGKCRDTTVEHRAAYSH